MTVAEQAIAAGAKAPTDRLGKRARRVTVGVYLDEQVAEDWERAAAELEQVRQRHLTEHTRRMGLALALARDNGQSEADAAAQVEEQMAAELAPLQERVEKAMVALDEATLWLTFRSLGRTRFRALMDEHKPSAVDQEDWEAAGQSGKAPYAPGSFAKALVQEASVQPVLSSADVLAMAEGEQWNDNEWVGVFQTALAAQTAARSVSHRPAPRR